MGMFSINAGYITEGVGGINIDDLDAQECFEENCVDAALRVVAETQNNWNSIMEAIGIEELCNYEETGSVIYESGTISGIFEKIKEFIKKLMEKIKGIFNKFMAVINSWVASDKEFVSKYKKQILSADMKDFKYKGFTFTNLDEGDNVENVFAKGTVIPVTINGVQYKLEQLTKDTATSNNLGGGNKAEEVIKDLREKKEDILEKYRGLTLGDVNQSIDSSEYSKELFEYFRNGDSNPDELDDTDIDRGELITIIQSKEKTQRAAEKIYRTVQKGFSDTIKELNRESNSILKEVPSKNSNGSPNTNATKTASNKVSVITAFISILEAVKSINVVWFGAYLQALKDQNRQAKSICVKIMTRKQPKNESTSLYDDGSSMLASVKLV